MMRCFILAALALASCGDAPVTNVAETEAPVEKAPLYSAATLEQARAALQSEKAIRDFVLDPDNAVILQAAVDDDGTRRYGYAEYLCMVLSEAGVAGDETAVRIVDAAKVEASRGDFRSISLGSVKCSDQSRLD
jgi:hypothetical protein